MGWVARGNTWQLTFTSSGRVVGFAEAALARNRSQIVARAKVRAVVHVVQLFLSDYRSSVQQSKSHKKVKSGDYKHFGWAVAAKRNDSRVMKVAASLLSTSCFEGQRSLSRP